MIPPALVLMSLNCKKKPVCELPEIWWKNDSLAFHSFQQRRKPWIEEQDEQGQNARKGVETAGSHVGNVWWSTKAASPLLVHIHPGQLPFWRCFSSGSCKKPTNNCCWFQCSALEHLRFGISIVEEEWHHHVWGCSKEEKERQERSKSLVWPVCHSSSQVHICAHSYEHKHTHTHTHTNTHTCTHRCVCGCLYFLMFLLDSLISFAKEIRVNRKHHMWWLSFLNLVNNTTMWVSYYGNQVV